MKTSAAMKRQKGFVARVSHSIKGVEPMPCTLISKSSNHENHIRLALGSKP